MSMSIREASRPPVATTRTPGARAKRGRARKRTLISIVERRGRDVRGGSRARAPGQGESAQDDVEEGRRQGRIDASASAEDRVRKAREYASELAKAKKASANEERGRERETEGNGAAIEANARARKREIKVQILTRDRDYNPFDDDEKSVGFETEDATYRPSVSTWGVFERPDNISTAYGGGRTIKREELEDEDAIAARKARVAKKLSKYREDNGMTMTPAEFEEARKALDEAEAAIKAGYMQAALERLEILALEKVGPKTELGGKIIFNYAMCLDNLQRRDEALKQYRRCVGNQYGNVSKQSDRMIWGMTTASRKMKSDLFDYMDAAKLDAYDEYLIKMANNKFSGDIDEEEEKQLRSTAITTMAVLFGTPLVFLAYLLTQR